MLRSAQIKPRLRERKRRKAGHRNPRTGRSWAASIPGTALRPTERRCSTTHPALGVSGHSTLRGPSHFPHGPRQSPAPCSTNLPKNRRWKIPLEQGGRLWPFYKVIIGPRLDKTSGNSGWEMLLGRSLFDPSQGESSRRYPPPDVSLLTLRLRPSGWSRRNDTRPSTTSWTRSISDDLVNEAIGDALYEDGIAKGGGKPLAEKALILAESGVAVGRKRFHSQLTSLGFNDWSGSVSKHCTFGGLHRGTE
jgi:hypothetical protein